MYERKELFDFSIQRVKEVGSAHSLELPQAFGRWFVEMYFENPQSLFVSDGSGDGQVDLFFTTSNDETVEHHVLNCKFTKAYNQRSPVSFYNEMTRFRQAFANVSARPAFLQKVVRPELRPRYRRLLEQYDQGRVRLMFVTNHARNERQYESVLTSDFQVVHLEDVMQFMVDNIEGAMPRTPTMVLTGIRGVLTADKRDTEVTTSIVFAKLTDLIKYMRKDPYELLFARNVRLSLGNTPANKEIRKTFINAPQEFAYSNNGITMLCEKHTPIPGTQELHIVNPRIVNGSQTLHSIRDVDNSKEAGRVMVRIIEIPPLGRTDISQEARMRREIIQKISIRSNLQNPIQKSDLVSNDDFQMSLARYFLKRRLFYERRKKEWTSRRAELRGRGIRRGPRIKPLAQALASFYWADRKLGPALAKSNVSELFEDKPYENIRETPPELAYQVYLLGEIIENSFELLSDSFRYIRNFGGHISLCLFSVLTRALQSAGAVWSQTQFTDFLERQKGGSHPSWNRLTKKSIDHIRQSYKKQAKNHRRTEGKELTFNNFFKNRSYVNRILRAPVPKQLRKLAKRVLSAS
jgi:hypothetical protein